MKELRYGHIEQNEITFKYFQEKKSNISDMRNLINQTVKDSNNLFYSPNYEEDLRREMFPIVDNLVLAVAAICDKNGIPSSSCELWEEQKGKIDKKTFVRITTNIRKDMERISKLFEKMEKRTKALNVQVEEKKREIKAIEASRDGLKATMKRKEHEAETKFEDMRSQMQYKLDIAQSDTLKVNERLSATLKEVECKSEEFKKARKSLEDLRRTSEIHMADKNTDLLKQIDRNQTMEQRVDQLVSFIFFYKIVIINISR